MKPRTITLFATAALLAASLITATPAHAGTAKTPMERATAGTASHARLASCVQRDRFQWTPTQYFNPGDCYQTPGAALVMQFDGALWLYFSDGNACFTPTRGAFGAFAVFQGDGNLVIYHNGGPIWESGTAGNYHARLILRGDGTLLIRNEAGEAIWDPGC